MATYSIERRGSEFVVKCDQQAILKVATKRLALAMIREARLRAAVAASERPAERPSVCARVPTCTAPVREALLVDVMAAHAS